MFDDEYLANNLNANYSVSSYKKTDTSVLIASGTFQGLSEWNSFYLALDQGSNYPSNSIRIALYGINS